jgi:hypothetical protein
MLDVGGYEHMLASCECSGEGVGIRDVVPSLKSRSAQRVFECYPD